MSNVYYLGPSLLFVTVAQALTKLETAPLWSSLFYFCILCISLSTLLVLLDTFVKSVATSCPKVAVKKLHLLILVCFFVFLSALGLVCKVNLLSK